MKKTILIFMFAMSFAIAIFCTGAMAETDATSDASAAANVNIDNSSKDTYEGSKLKRDLPAQSLSGPYPMVPNLIHDGGSAGNVQHPKEILSMRKVFTYEMLEAIAQGEKIEINAKGYNKYKCHFDDKKLKDSDTITIALELPKEPFEDVGYVTTYGKKTKSTTFAAIAKAAIQFMKWGCDTMVVSGYGARKFLEGTGWGIMIGGTSVTLNETSDAAVGTVGTGGFGWAKAEASYGYKPWVQCWGLRTKNIRKNK